MVKPRFPVWRRGFIVSLASVLALSCLNTPAYSEWDEFEVAENASQFVDELKFDTLEEMKSAGLEQAQLPIQPWSDSYWPIYHGGLANRYADPMFPRDQGWNEFSDYILGSLGSVPVVGMSPAEKYDLLLDDSDFTLTRKMISLGADLAIGGKIEEWLGFCNGWANAAVMMPRPEHAVTVTAADGKTQIEFFPSDIKALADLLWSNGSFPFRLLGTLCREDPPRRDQAGRPLSPSCRSPNPGAWHLSVVNQIGVNHRGFVIDAVPGNQIWNHPLYSYQYQYFNPATGQFAPLEQAKVALRDFVSDPFAAFRSKKTRWVVGIEMKTVILFITDPSTRRTDSPADDVTRNPVYRYDLELDDAGRIIGGEWLSQLHPSVMWIPERKARAVSVGDALLDPTSYWNAGEPLPKTWLDPAHKALKFTQPLAEIVEKLFEWAH